MVSVHAQSSVACYLWKAVAIYEYMALQHMFSGSSSLNNMLMVCENFDNGGLGHLRSAIQKTCIYVAAKSFESDQFPGATRTQPSLQ
jgi:hypothetical protein